MPVVSVVGLKGSVSGINLSHSPFFVTDAESSLCQLQVFLKSESWEVVDHMPTLTPCDVKAGGSESYLLGGKPDPLAPKMVPQKGGGSPQSDLEC